MRREHAKPKKKVNSWIKKGSDSPQQENADPTAKLLLRRYFLDKYYPGAKMGVENPAPAPTVFDACQAGGLLWGTLRQEYRVRYWGVDLKPQKRGTLKMDSARVLTQANDFDIVDIDTFGSPWHHWLVMLPNIRKPTIVFLTLGKVAAINEIGNDALTWLGLAHLVNLVPNSLRWKISDYSWSTLLAAPYAYSLTIDEAQEATASNNARYLGVRLSPST
jgi:hypothetical protein